MGRSRRRSRLIYAALAYLASVILLLGALFWFLSLNGFDERNFIVGSVGILLLALIFGYILSSDLLAPKWEMDAKFTHMSKEILHELNLPLSTIAANTKMMKKSCDDEKSHRRLERIVSASQRLKRLYDELVYTINKEIHKVEKEQFPLKELLKERIEVHKNFGRNPFELDVEDVTLLADRIGFEQMIDNILSNAMKYSDKSSPITISTDGQNLMISDRGIGMSEGELIKIFERYYQTDESRNGEGIGLALVKSYCDESKIGISIFSKPGEGTTVKLDLSNCLTLN